jgi:hypothetical protein
VRREIGEARYIDVVGMDILEGVSGFACFYIKNYGVARISGHQKAIIRRIPRNTLVMKKGQIDIYLQVDTSEAIKYWIFFNLRALFG